MVEAGLSNRDNGLPMVTLAEKISESEPRRFRRLPGSPCTWATQDATAVKSLHRDHLSRFYPQGSTAIPACETNYPGAAAQPQPPVSAKFREGDPTRGFGLSPNALDINGANTYQFVMSNPVGSVDAWRLSAAVDSLPQAADLTPAQAQQQVGPGWEVTGNPELTSNRAKVAQFAMVESAEGKQYVETLFGDLKLAVPAGF